MRVRPPARDLERGGGPAVLQEACLYSTLGLGFVTLRRQEVLYVYVCRC